MYRLDTLTYIYVCVVFVYMCVAFQTEGKLYLILDFLRGGDLFTRLSKEVGLLALCPPPLIKELQFLPFSRFVIGCLTPGTSL